LVLISECDHVNRNDIIRYVKENGISELCIPRQILYVDHMPLLASGKINYPSANRLADHLKQAEAVV